jgi:hypothetical protein
MLFSDVFIMRYRLELILAFPLVALVMAVDLSLALQENGAAQAHATLTREPLLMASMIACGLLMEILLWLNIPILQSIFAPTAPANVQGYGDNVFPHENCMHRSDGADLPQNCPK